MLLTVTQHTLLYSYPINVRIRRAHIPAWGGPAGPSELNLSRSGPVHPEEGISDTPRPPNATRGSSHEEPSSLPLSLSRSLFLFLSVSVSLSVSPPLVFSLCSGLGALDQQKDPTALIQEVGVTSSAVPPEKQ